ncbi:MAG: YncE family protein, partial [Planctomycetota bacterium]
GFGQTSLVNWESPQINAIELTPDGQLLLVVNTSDNRLEVSDNSTGSPVFLRSVAVGLDPVSVRARTNTEAWVVNHISDSFSIVDLPTGRVIRTVLTGDEPTDVVFAGNPERAFVSMSQVNQVWVFDPANLATAPIVVSIQGEDPRALAVDVTGSKVFVAIAESGNNTTIVDQIAVSAPAGPYGGVNPPPNSGNLFDPPRTPGQPPPPPVPQIVRRNALGEWRDDNNRNWSAQVTWGLHDQDVAIIDTATLGVTYATGLMTTVTALAVSPAGLVTAVGTEALNEIRFEPNVSGIFIRANLASFDPTTPSAVTITDMNPHLDYSTNSVPQATRDLSIGDPRGIAWRPQGDRAYVTGMGSSNVVIMDSTGARLGLIDIGAGPTGLVMNSAGDRLYVLNRFDASISVIDAENNVELERVSFFDPTPASIKLGRPFLYNTHLTSGLGQAACASCHIDARTDHLGWDLGSPAGEVKEVNQDCRQGEGNCADWHPMKGPMVTQSLINIVGSEPFHWRGDRETVAAFAPAFVGLQGADAEPTAEEMQMLTDFVASLRFPPNPNRNIDGTLRTVVTTTNGTGNAQTGRNIYLNQPVLGGVLTCAACHALPSGTDQTVDFPPVGPNAQTLKVVQLRNMYEKTGFNRATLTGNRGFGFNHEGDVDTLFNFLVGNGFTFPPGPPGNQQRRDVEAFMLSLSIDTHAGVGQQVTFDGINNGNAQLITRFNSFVTLANGAQVGLVAKGVQGGLDRGYTYLGAGTFQSDRAGETIASNALRTSAALGSELTFTMVPFGSQQRIGIDRDEDGHFDRDELDGCSDPADPTSVPVVYGDLDGSGIVDIDDLGCTLNAFMLLSSCPAADIFPCGGGDGLVDLDDLIGLLNAFAGISLCPGPCAG